MNDISFFIFKNLFELYKARLHINIFNKKLLKYVLFINNVFIYFENYYLNIFKNIYLEFYFLYKINIYRFKKYIYKTSYICNY